MKRLRQLEKERKTDKRKKERKKKERKKRGIR